MGVGFFFAGFRHKISCLRGGAQLLEIVKEALRSEAVGGACKEKIG